MERDSVIGPHSHRRWGRLVCQAQIYGSASVTRVARASEHYGALHPSADDIVPPSCTSKRWKLSALAHRPSVGAAPYNPGVLVGAARWYWGIFHSCQFFAHSQRRRRSQLFCDMGPLTLHVKMWLLYWLASYKQQSCNIFSVWQEIKLWSHFQVVWTIFT